MNEIVSSFILKGKKRLNNRKVRATWTMRFCRRF